VGPSGPAYLEIFMQRTPVKSSNIRAVGYDAATQTLEVEFGSGVYQYQGVPPEKHAKLMGAESVGKFIRAEIRGKFDSRKVGGDQ